MADDLWQNGKLTFDLERPIPDPENADGKLSSITLREPNGGDVIEAGNPVSFNPLNDAEPFKIDERKMGAMISRLSALPPSFLAKMTTKDMIRLGNILAPFFLPF